MNRPDNMLTYNEMNLKLGIKSSLRHIKSVIGLAILLWECSDHPAQLDFSVQKGNEISLNDALADRIKKYMTEVFDDTRITEDGLISIINQNQLFKAQMETLIVAFELVWKIAIVEFIDNTKAASAERTKRIRFPKRLNYSVNIDIIHSVIDGNKEKYLHVLLNWIGFDIDFDPDFETTLIKLLTALSETAVFKLSDGDKDVIFNQNSIYMKLLETSEKVDIKGDKEGRGSLRILKSLLSDGMNSYLDYSKGLVSYSDSDRDSLESYQKRVDTFLKLCATKAIETNNDDISTDILNHNLFGIHIKGQNDALSEDRPHICIGWSALGDLSNVNSKEELTSLFAETWPDAKSKSQGQNIGQVWRFKNDIQIGDYVAFSDGNLLHIGRVESDYYYDGTPYSTQDSDYKNSRNVVWLKKNIQRTELSETLHRALGVGMSIWTMNDYRAAIADLINGTYVKYEDEDGEESTELCYYTQFPSSKPRNRIIFGAPGTGKSFMLNRERKELLGEDNNADYERVTFHPDYSYANFVGTYKPISAFDSEGKEIITYEYVPGPFMRVYVNALKNGRTDDVKPFLLIIEEINRANIAAVFGDIFQLLDRDENQVSEYPIQASEDMKKYLAKELGGEPDDYAKIKLPDNMFIWATMNSADQGVYPMDTAFKRRWNFEYIGINDGENKVDYNVKIPVKNNRIQNVKWNKLRKRINDNLLKEEVNEDKLLGPFFISKNALKNAEKDSEAFAKIFKSKVIMYLFEDVARQKKIRNNVFPGFANNNSTITLSGLFGKFDEIGVELFGLMGGEFRSEDNSRSLDDSVDTDDEDPADEPQTVKPQDADQQEVSEEEDNESDTETSPTDGGEE